MKWIKKLIIFLITVGSISFLLTLIGKSSSSMNLTTLFLDRLFTVNLIVFIICGIAFIDNFGTFNVFKYSVKHFHVTLSKKYKYQMFAENEELKTDSDIKSYLQKKYLFAKTKHNAANVYFAFSAIILISFLVVTFIAI